MKSVHIDKNTNLVVNVTGGIPEAPGPEHIFYEVVEDDFYVGPGFTRVGEKQYVPPLRPSDAD